MIPQPSMPRSPPPEHDVGGGELLGVTGGDDRESGEVLKLLVFGQLLQFVLLHELGEQGLGNRIHGCPPDARQFGRSGIVNCARWPVNLPGTQTGTEPVPFRSEFDKRKYAPHAERLSGSQKQPLGSPAATGVQPEPPREGYAGHTEDRIRGPKPRPVFGFHDFRNWSGRRDSNSRPQPWQGCALPLSYARTPRGGLIGEGAGLGQAPSPATGRRRRTLLRSRLTCGECSCIVLIWPARVGKADRRRLSGDRRRKIR